ncbi:hypothetical protein [Oryza sativa Japonica Group]|uniref:Uncharacterized protein n=1 Tax=Oryza sativa subsp. japonica TaxID=39947 RepID=Q5QMJ9_ORYSJ|nr:hypothetical protein [Oryza sativa Japonica Group]
MSHDRPLLSAFLNLRLMPSPFHLILSHPMQRLNGNADHALAALERALSIAAATASPFPSIG